MKPVSYVCFFNVMNHAVYIRIEQQIWLLFSCYRGIYCDICDLYFVFYFNFIDFEIRILKIEIANHRIEILCQATTNIISKR